MSKRIPLEEKPLADSTVTRLLTYSPYSKCSLDYNIEKCLDEYQLSQFWRYVCILQVKRTDLEIFNKYDFEQFIAKCFSDRNDELRRKEYENHRKVMENEFNKNILDDLIHDADYYIQSLGAEEYNLRIKHYTELVNNPEIVDEKIEEVLPFRDIEDLYPIPQECQELWQKYNAPTAPKKENALLNSIASLLHTVKEAELNRILAYYLVPEKRIKLAEHPVLDAVSNDPYIIHPQLKRPITEKLVDSLYYYAQKYKGLQADKIVYKWLETAKKRNKLDTFKSLILALQIDGIAEIIEQSAFYIKFQKHIEFYQKGISYIVPSNDDFFSAMENLNNDKDHLVREIAILVNEGYTYQEIYDYYKCKPTSNNGIVF